MEKVKKLSPFRLSSLLRQQKDPKIALQLFLNPNPSHGTDHTTKPISYSPTSYDLIICKLGRAKLFKEMEQILDKLRHDTRISPKEVIFCNVISFYGRAHLPEKALHMFTEIPSFRCPRSIKSVNSLLNALLVCKEYAKIGEILKNFESYGTPDVFTFNILMNASCLCGDLDRAREVFAEMQKRGVQPNVVTFGTLINGLCVNQDLNEAFRMKKMMERNFKLKPNAFVYVALIKRLCMVDNFESAVELKEEMLKKKVELDSAVYSTLISAYFRVGRKEEVYGLLTEMEKNGCKCDTVTFNALMHGYCQEKDFDSAFSILNEMEEKGCKPDVVSCNVILRGLCNDGKLREASELLDDMPRQRCKPDVVSYRIYFDGLCKAMQFKEAAVILDEMIFKGYIPRDTSLNKLFHGLIHEEDKESLLRALNNMASVNCISQEMWEMMISMMCQQDNLCNASGLVGALMME
ncbi:PREDICTED: putative pentatricopeptide repeat-containing protein At1g53330 [Nicotiana attenuata]|uniref:Pentatricopeptide repeat-containing protein n=1 Tax=Nicotiana attenuata TaxID=49451 RepID=A0A1J6IVW7_NICAT|nr:PREDICTED: putative pentatricopeptide repeat-containing protein At1g53330 [Nicotiana attenuata]OIT01863.1 putative pentatricopeptide repeat-containing protein [Nicotiana attenuata]